MKLLRKILYIIYYNLFLKRKLKKTIEEKFGSFSFKVYSSVFNPNEFVSSRVFASYIGSLDLNGKKILDMGCGSGIVSVIAASKGAVCTAVDINPMAVKSTAENAAANGFADKIKVHEGNLFDPTLSLPKGEGIKVPSPLGRDNSDLNRSRVGYSNYDIIFFNPPYYKGVPANDFERAFKGGDNYEVIGEFLKTAREYLSPGGYICMIVSSDMGLNEFINLAVSYGYKYEILLKKEKLFETFYIVKLV